MTVIPEVGFWLAFFAVVILPILGFLIWGSRSPDMWMIIESLGEDKYAWRYYAFLNSALNKIMFVCTARDLRQRRGLFAWKEVGKRNRHPLSYGLLDYALVAGMVYPVACLLLQWSLSGDAIRLAGAVIVPAQADPIRRMLVVAVVLLSGIAFTLYDGTLPNRFFSPPADNAPSKEIFYWKIRAVLVNTPLILISAVVTLFALYKLSGLWLYSIAFIAIINIPAKSGARIPLLLAAMVVAIASATAFQSTYLNPCRGSLRFGIRTTSQTAGKSNSTADTGPARIYISDVDPACCRNNCGAA